MQTLERDPWNPDQYGKFLREREQPFYDLMALVQRDAGMRVVDLGCGTGKLTRVLHETLAARETVGIDRSTRMLESAGAGPQPQGLRFETADIESFPRDGERFDLVFSNAALHWVDHHEALFERLASALGPRGQLAVQVPAMHDNPSHLLAAELMTMEPFQSASGGWQRSQPVLMPEKYAQLLFSLGFSDPVVRLIVYPHVLADSDAVIEWMKGTLLAEYSRHLPAAVFEEFLAEYRRRLLLLVGTSQPFFFPFKRILCWGRRSA